MAAWIPASRLTARSLHPSVWVPPTVNPLPCRPTGNILVGGYAAGASGDEYALARYNSDGSLDTSFSGDGIVTTPFGSGDAYGESLTLQTDGKILVSGYYFSGAANLLSLARYNADGSLDTSFSGDGLLTTSFGGVDNYGFDVAVQSDGAIVVVGRSSAMGTPDVAVARYDSSGNLDTTFSGDGLLTTPIGTGLDNAYSVSVQDDGKLLVAGYSFNGTNNDFALVRYNSNGTLDTSFGGGDGIVTTAVGAGNDAGYSVTVQADGKILVAGLSLIGGNNDFALVRYNSDGTLDTSFGGGDGIATTAVGAGNDGGYSVMVQADGKIVVAGTSNNGSNDDFAVVRYNSDGSLDTGFDSILANTLNGTPTFIENGAAVVLDADVQIFDAELSALDNFSGATLTLARNGGASAQDVFSATVTLSALTQGGNLVVGGTTIGTVTTNSGGTLVLTFNASATNTLVNSAMQQIAYSNSSDTPPASVQIDWTFNDGNTGSQGSGGALSCTGSVTVSITPVNDAPELTGAGMYLTTITEDPTVNNGDLVSAIIARAGGDPITDADAGALEGIAIFSLSNSNGTWQYDIGSGWTDVGTVTVNSSLLLRDSDSLRFVPNADWNGLEMVTFAAWDQTSGTAGAKVDTSAFGGTTAFSVGTAVASFTVTAVNDSPTIAVNTGATFDQGSTDNIITTAMLNEGDPDDSGSGVTYTLDADPVTGRLFLSGVQLAGGGTFTQDDIDSARVTYDHNGVGTAPDSFDFTITDGGENGSTPVSGTFIITISPVDAGVPVVTTSGGATAYAEQASATVIDAALTLVDSDGFGGADPSDQFTGVITITGNYTAGDILGFTDTANIEGNLVGNQLYLSVVSGQTATVAEFEAAFRAVTFYNGSDTPSELDRTVSFSFDDGIESSNVPTKTVQVTAVNDDPVITSDGGGASATVNIMENSTAVTTVISTDVDGGAAIYSISGGTDAAKFAINSSSGVMTFAAAPDYEIPTDADGDNVYEVQVTVSDGAGGSDVQALSVTVTDDNDNEPVITTGQTFSVSEAAANGTSLGIVAATDPDTVGMLQNWTILSGNDDGVFAINAATGELTVADNTNLDFETTSSYTLFLAVYDGPNMSGGESVEINVTDINESVVGPVTDSNAAANTVAEDAIVGTTVGITALATDADGTDTVTYSLSDDAGGLFTIDANTGVITVANALDYETATSHSVTVLATSSDTSTSSQAFTINVTDVNESAVGPVTDSNVAANTVAEDAIVGTTVGITALATDADGTDTVTYSLSDDAGGLFTIDANTGVITVANALDYETATSHRLPFWPPLQTPAPAVRRLPSMLRM